MTTRTQILQEARSWLGTPWVHAQRTKGAGVDCANFVSAVFEAVQLVKHVEPGYYPADWYLHQDEERILKILQDNGRRVDEPQPGDIAAYKFGRCVSHLAIIEDDEFILHAFVQAERVTRTERSMLEPRLHSYWTVF